MVIDKSRSSMATVNWSDLPADILASIAKTTVDLPRLRSVCSSWRSSLAPPRKPISFPLRWPTLFATPFVYKLDDYFTLHERTIYRLAPLDNSNAWLFKVSEINPNPTTFSVLETLVTRKIPLPESMPRQLNLLDYRVSEVCKSYTITLSVGGLDDSEEPVYDFDKVIALWNYVAGCDLALVVLQSNGLLSLWEFGDECWTPINTNGYDFHDLILYDGKCYAVDGSGLLVSYDSVFNMTPVAHSPVDSDHGRRFRNYLVEGDSDLHMVSIIISLQSNGPIRREYLKLILKKLNKCKGRWDSMNESGELIFLLCDDVSFCISHKDFGGCKGNRVFLDDISVNDYNDYGDCHVPGVYHLDNGSIFRSTASQDFAKLLWPPPSWLHAPHCSLKNMD